MDISAFAKLSYQLAKGQDPMLTEFLSPQDPNAIDGLLARAATHRLTPLIAHYLDAHKDQLSLSPEQREKLQTNRPMLATARAAAIKAQLLEIDAALMGTKIHPVLLKGAIQIFDDLYPSAALRQMADIDVLCTDLQFGAALRKLGYAPVADGDDAQRLFDEGKTQFISDHHLPAVTRSKDLVWLEPHLAAVAPRYAHLVPDNFEVDVVDVPNCTHLKKPRPENHLIHMLVHTLKHDRETLEGGMLLRGLIECELIYKRLDTAQQANCIAHFQKCGAISFWNNWRALSQWAFDGQNTTRSYALSARILIGEFQMRSKGDLAVFTVSVAHRILALFDPRFWSSQTYKMQLGRFAKRDFWGKTFSRFASAIRK